MTVRDSMVNGRKRNERRKAFYSIVADRIAMHEKQQEELPEPYGADKDMCENLSIRLSELGLINDGIDWMELRRNDWPFTEYC